MIGCNNLAVDYDRGLGIERDPMKAAELWQRACDGGNMDGCASLGVDYEYGAGVARDVTRAGALYKQACDGGNQRGCTNARNLRAHDTR